MARPSDDRRRRPWPDCVVVTLGTDGAVAIGRDGSVVTAPAPPTKAVDATGSGDSFVGSLLAAWLNDCPLELGLRLACVAGSLQVSEFGAPDMRPTALRLLTLVGAEFPAHAWSRKTAMIMTQGDAGGWWNGVGPTRLARFVDPVRAVRG